MQRSQLGASEIQDKSKCNVSKSLMGIASADPGEGKTENLYRYFNMISL